MVQLIHDIPAWIAVNKDLASVGRRIVGYLTGADGKKHPQNNVLAGFSRKAANTLDAIQLLVDHKHWEEAQVLTRVLFELRATFACFWEMFTDDDVAATQRIFDCMMLDKFKQIRTVNRKDFDDAVDRDSWETEIEGIESRYDPDDLERMKKHGFTGKSVEQRCRHANLAHVYEIIYRNFSRNVHSTDFIEQVGNSVFDDDPQYNDYLESRNTTMLYVANFSAGGVLVCTDVCDMFAQEFAELKQRQKTLTQHIDPDEGF